MLRKIALVSAVSGLTIATALAQSPAPPAGAPGEPPAATQSTPKADMPASRVETKPSAMGDGANFVASQKPDQWLASKFKGTDVLGPDNEKVGDVTDILFDKNGKIDAYVVSVGGFLGIGAKEVALPPSAFQVVAPDSSNAPAASSGSSSKLKISMTKDQLKQAANFEAYKEPPRTTTGTGGAPRPMAPAPTR
jgi:hypothetical protein